MKRTNRDILFALFDELVGPQRGEQMKAEFVQRVLPALPGMKIDAEISEAEFQYAAAKIKEEAPAFAHYLRHADLPYTPPEMWNARRA